MKKYKSTLILTSIITLLPILIGVLLWPQLPDSIATHFNFGNTADGWSSKVFAVFGLPVILLAVHWLSIVFMLNDPKKKNIGDKIFGLMLWVVPAISLITSVLIYCNALGYTLSTGLAANLLLGVLLIVIGNLLPKCKQSYTVGIKLPWTLSSEENWNRTHRLAGWIWVLGGAAYIVNAFFLSKWIFIPTIILMIGIPTAYSFVLYRKGV